MNQQNKKLVKVYFKKNLFSMTPKLEKKSSYAIPTIIGAGLGGAFGTIPSVEQYPKNRRKEKKFTNVIRGAIAGAGTGLLLSHSFKKLKPKYSSGPEYGYSSGPEYGHSSGPEYRYSSGPIYKHLPNIENVRTKAEAKSIFRREALKHHPDKGGNAKKIKELNNDWQDILKSNWFQKLAFLTKKTLFKLKRR